MLYHEAAFPLQLYLLLQDILENILQMKLLPGINLKFWYFFRIKLKEKKSVNVALSNVLACKIQKLRFSIHKLYFEQQN